MSSSVPRRPVCPRCARPAPACVCAWVSFVDNPTAVCVLQHPDEEGHAKGTVPLLRLGLARCEVHVGEVFAPDELGLGRLGDWALLYPAERADVGQQRPSPAWPMPNPLRGLLVLDGTWRKTLRLLCSNPWLAALPRLALDPTPPSAYRIRQARHAHQLSTLEATCHALGQIEGAPQRYAGLLRGQRGFVAEVARRMPQRTASTEPEPATDDFSCGGLPE